MYNYLIWSIISSVKLQNIPNLGLLSVNNSSEFRSSVPLYEMTDNIMYMLNNKDGFIRYSNTLEIVASGSFEM